MDGTLFDTERIYRKAWMRAGVPENIYYEMVGQSREAILALFRKMPELDPRETLDLVNRYSAEATKRAVPEKPGLREALPRIRAAGLKTAIASSSSGEIIRRYLATSKTADFFDVCVSGNEVPRGKPYPDIWLAAAKRLDVPAEQCVVVEDSYNGVRSGHAAGMFTVMIPDIRQPSPEIRALTDAVLPSLADLVPLLERKQEQ